MAIANTAPEAQAQTELRPVFEKLLTLMQRTDRSTPDEKIRVLRAFEVAASQLTGPASIRRSRSRCTRR